MGVMLASLENEIRQFVANFSGVSFKRVQLASDLAGDLGIAGMDGIELMEAFSKRFAVDLQNFPVAYFGEESPFNPLWWMWMRVFDRERLLLKPLNVQDLVTAAGAGHWAPPLTPLTNPR